MNRQKQSEIESGLAESTDWEEYARAILDAQHAAQYADHCEQFLRSYYNTPGFDEAFDRSYADGPCILEDERVPF